jgi:diguanylate cyclase (GGDEF)-like protein
MDRLHDSWWRLVESLQTLPTRELGEPEWGRRLVTAAREALGVVALRCRLPLPGGGWQVWESPAGGADRLSPDAPRLRAPIPLVGEQAGELEVLLPGATTSDGGRAGGTGDGTVQPEAGTVQPVPGAASQATVDALARQVARALANRDRVRHLSEQVITDELTGAYNYRHLLKALRHEVERAQRFGHPLSILMLDVDHLKEYNEQHGHLRGSALLRDLAAELRAATRDIDVLAKYGGDEFLLILPHTDKDGALVLAKRLCRRVEARAFTPLPAGAMTCSIGVAACPADGIEPDLLMAAADQALFAAKRAGRNRVQAA